MNKNLLLSLVSAVVLTTLGCSGSGQKLPFNHTLGTGGVQAASQTQDAQLSKILSTPSPCMLLKDVVDRLNAMTASSFDIFIANMDLGSVDSTGNTFKSLGDEITTAKLVLPQLQQTKPLALVEILNGNPSSSALAGELLSIKSQDTCKSVTFQSATDANPETFLVTGVPTPSTTTPTTATTAAAAAAAAANAPTKIVVTDPTSGERRVYRATGNQLVITVDKPAPSVTTCAGQTNSTLTQRVTYVVDFSQTQESFRLSRVFAQMLADSLKTPQAQLVAALASVAAPAQSNGNGTTARPAQNPGTVPLLYSTLYLTSNDILKVQAQDLQCKNN